MAVSLRGRTEEISTLSTALDRAHAGQGTALVVAGEPGMGRTSLVAAIRCLAGDGVLVLPAAGVEAEAGIPLAGLHGLLGPVADLVPTIDPWHAEALSAVFADGPAPSAFALGRAVHRLLAEAARGRPVLCLVDDVHLLDGASTGALAFTARRLTTEPVLLVLTSVLTPASTQPSDPLAAIPRLPLTALDATTCRCVLADLIPDGLPDDLAGELAELAAGNPLALVELAAALTPDQLAGDAPGPYHLPPGSRLRTGLRRRFGALSADARRLVVMAVVDEDLEVDTLVRAAGDAGIDLAALGEATCAGLVRIEGDRVRVTGRLARSTLHADVPLADRLVAHRLLAAALDPRQHRLRRTLHQVAIADGPRDRLADELARAADGDRTDSASSGASSGASSESSGAGGADVDVLGRAYQRAAALTTEPRLKVLRLIDAASVLSLAGRTRQATALLRQARPLGTTADLRGRVDLLHGDIELRDGSPALANQTLLNAAEQLCESDRTLAVTALVLAGEASSLAGSYAHYQDVTRRAEQLRRPDEPPATALMFDYIAGTAATYAGRHAEAVEPLRRVLRLAENSDDALPKIWASDAAYILGDAVVAQELATQAVSAARDQGRPALLPWAYVYLSMAALLHDRHTTAMSTSQEAMRVAGATGQRNRVVDHLTILALGAALIGDRETARLRLDIASREAHRRGLGRPSALSSWAAACADLADDRPADAMDRLRAMSAGTGYLHPAIRVLAAPHFVEAAVRCGERTKAEHALEVFDRWANTTGSTPRLAQSHRCHALLAGGGAGTDEHFREAIRLHRASNTALELAKTELFYAHQLRLSRKPRAAREHLRDALKIFEQYGAGPWARRTRAELRAAGEAVTPTASPTTSPSTQQLTTQLTPQQAQIAELVAEGATNREIAAQLVVSPRTVDHHVRNILAKLGVRSRVELAALLR